MTMLCAGCGTTYQEVAEVNVTEESYANGYFTVISKWGDADKIFRIVYANDTKVKYFISEASYGSHAITPLYNADGTLQIYDGE